MLFCLAWLKCLILGLFSFNSDEPRREGKKDVCVFFCACFPLQLYRMWSDSNPPAVCSTGHFTCTVCDSVGPTLLCQDPGLFSIEEKRGHEINSSAFPVVALVVASFLKFPYLTNPVSYNNS